MAVTEQAYTGDGSTTNYPFTFPYLKSTDITVTVDDAVTTAWSLANATTVQFNSAPDNQVAIKILRKTNVDNLTATFYAGSAIKSEDLNDNYTQNLYVTQEIGNRSFENTGLSTMIGNLNMGEDTSIVFEGATDDAHETKLTVADPTADRTITIPNVTGTVITTGDTGTVTSTIIADGTIVNGDIANTTITGGKLVDNTLTATQIAADAVTSSELANSSVTQLKIANNSIVSSHIVSDQVTATHIAANAVGSSELADNAVDTGAIAANAVTASELADDAVDTAAIVDNAVTMDKLNSGALPTDITVASANIVNNTIVAADIANDTITATQIAADAITSSELGPDAVTADNIGNDVINSEHYAADSIDTEHYAALSVDSAALAAGAVIEAKVGNDQITADKLADHASTDSSRAVTTDHIRDNAITIAKIGCEETTLTTNSDLKLPTSKAVADHVANVVDSVGGFKIVADKDSFPEAHPDPKGDAGMVISVTNPVGLVVNGSGVSTTGDTITSDGTVTINGLPSGVHSSTLTANYTLLLQTTSTAHTYDFYRFLAKDADVLNLSDDIQDFGNRYRTATNRTADNSNTNDDGDLFYDQTANKMYVYEGAYDSGGAWKEVTSTGQFKILTVVPENATSGTPDYSQDTFDLRDGSNAASVTQASQLIVSVNGVIQKPNSGTSAPSEGFALEDSHTIVFGSAPGAGASVFVTQCGSAVTINVPADGSVTEAMLNANAPTNNHVLTADSSAASGFKWAAGGDSEKIELNNTRLEVVDVNGTNERIVAHIDGTSDPTFAINGDGISLGKSDTEGSLSLNGAIKFGAHAAGTSPYIRMAGSPSYLEITGAYNAGNSIGTVWTFGGYQGTHVSAGNINPSADSTYSLGTNSVRWTNGYFDNLYGDGSNLTGVAASSANGTMYKNTLSITDAHTIAATEGAHSVGPVSVGNTVTISGRWVIS